MSATGVMAPPSILPVGVTTGRYMLHPAVISTSGSGRESEVNGGTATISSLSHSAVQEAVFTSSSSPGWPLTHAPRPFCGKVMKVMKHRPIVSGYV